MKGGREEKGVRREGEGEGKKREGGMKGGREERGEIRKEGEGREGSEREVKGKGKGGIKGGREERCEGRRG